MLVHFHKIYISELIFDPWEITYSLKTIDENSVICVKPEVIPFSEKILPKKYNKHFENSINKYNVSELWNDVQTIKQRYFSSAISADREYSKDYLSEASYEIARYIENVRWAGDEPKVPDEFRSVNNCLSYVDMDQEQFSYYLFWRTKILDGIVIPPHNLGFIGTLLSELIIIELSFRADLIWRTTV